MKQMFDFQLWEPGDILCSFIPSEGTQNIFWSDLTSCNYCMNFGDATLFQYTREVLDLWGNSSLNKGRRLSECDDYMMQRVLHDDFDDVLWHLGEPIPEDFHSITQSAETLLAYQRKYNDFNDALCTRLEEDFPENSQTPEKEAREDKIYHYEETLHHWLSHRRWWQWYLTYSLQIWFCRYGDDIQIVWDSAREYEGVPVWMAQSGTYRMKYADFVREMEDFGNRFFTAMEEQVRKAVAMNWGDVEIDKPGLWAAQKKNQELYAGLINRLKNPECDTDWAEVRDTIREAFPGEYFK